LLLSSKLWRCMKNHSNPADQPSWTCTYLILDQEQSTDPCLTTFIITEDDMKPPKMLPYCIIVECQTMIIWTSHHSTPTNKHSPSGIGFSWDFLQLTDPCLEIAIMSGLPHKVDPNSNLHQSKKVYCLCIPVLIVSYYGCHHQHIKWNARTLWQMGIIRSGWCRFEFGSSQNKFICGVALYMIANKGVPPCK